MSYTTSVSNNNITISFSSPEHSISLARTGGQGTKGDSVTNVTINENSELLVEISNAAGVVIETINAGPLFSELQLEEIENVTINDPLEEGDYIAYNSVESRYENYKLTTAKVLDIDNTNKEDGALLVYNSTSEKYTATATLDNVNTSIIGGTF